MGKSHLLAALECLLALSETFDESRLWARFDSWPAFYHLYCFGFDVFMWASKTE